ncbi:hypothetical protein [Fibrobacter sp. UWB12]|uniref:hypothetical protein n=1 Tax=Fibrobacter sp. UWB12 TaxID=1896203 RepID=UPI00090EEBE3|nr:hypothetical protein [Fibrobacter sp. UWB12]SHK67198.1 hypothetical protein SAMN05720759_10549 [Fibrobacter sp. UWB12]
MNNCCCVPALGLAFFSWAFSCPQFVEFFPDPKNVSDQEGEYVEIRLDEFRADSLFVRFENKEILAFEWPEAERLVLVHDSSQCPMRKNVACGMLGKVSLPNSRESIWKAWSGVCMDSVTVPQPKPGKAIQRVGLTDEWVFVAGTFGAGDPEYELGVEEDSLLALVSELGKQGRTLRMTEIHQCPEEPMPEWVELYNASAYTLPLQEFRFCDRGSVLGNVNDSILPFQTLLVSKDTAALREVLGIPDIHMVQVSLGYLNNIEGSLRLCFRNEVVDSAFWNKGTVSCPSGFNPLTGKREFTPGYQPKSVGIGGGRTSTNASINVPINAPLTYKLSSRVASKKGAALRVRVDSEHDVMLALLDSAGRRVWKSVVSAMSNEWVKVPAQEYLGVGVGYVAFSVGEYEDVVGILVRP